MTTRKLFEVLSYQFLVISKTKDCEKLRNRFAKISQHRQEMTAALATTESAAASAANRFRLALQVRQQVEQHCAEKALCISALPQRRFEKVL